MNDYELSFLSETKKIGMKILDSYESKQFLHADINKLIKKIPSSFENFIDKKNSSYFSVSSR